MVEVNDCRYGPMMYLLNDRFIGRSLHAYGEAHYHEVEFLKKLVVAGDVVVDAGANIGVVTCPLAQSLGSEGYVVAVEAQPFIYNMLCGNLALNSLHNVQPLNRALAHTSNLQAYMPGIDYTAEDNFGGVSLSPTRIDSRGKSVPTLAIDDLRLFKPKLLKIDVEGMEVQVLRGAVDTIRRAKPYLYVEFLGDEEGILEFLKEIDYDWKVHQPFMYNEDNFLHNPVDMFMNEHGVHLASLDLICWPKGTELGASSTFLIDVDTSPVPKHMEIKKLKDKVNGSGSS